MLIRPVPEHVDSIDRIVREVLSPEDQSFVAEFAERAAKLQRSHFADLVFATRDGAAIGYGDIQYILHTTRGRMARICSLIVNAEGQIGERARMKMLTMLIDLAETKGCCRIDATVENLEVADMLAEFGFKSESTTIVMRRKTGALALSPTGPDISVYKMRPGQYPLVREVLLPMVSGGDVQCDPSDISNYVQSGTFIPILVRDFEEPLAYAELLVMLDARRGLTGRIEHVAVAPSARGQGIGTALTRWLIQIAEDRSLAFIELTVESEDALRLYIKQGFVPTEHKHMRLEF